MLCFLWGTNWILKYYLEELRLQRVQHRLKYSMQSQTSWQTSHFVQHQPVHVLRVSGGLKVSVKKTRAPADLEESLDDRNVQATEPSTVPPGFLSPSVKEYLELGKSIPGKTKCYSQVQRFWPLWCVNWNLWACHHKFAGRDEREGKEGGRKGQI
jgi:hypothetical protein